MAALEHLRFRASIEGPHGSGKTTMLEGLAPRLQGQGHSIEFIRLNSATRKMPAAFLRSVTTDQASRQILIVDGADLLGRASWLCLKLLSKRAGGLIIATHRKGMLPLLMECSTNPDLLNEIVTDLVGEEAESLHQLNAMLFTKHNGNLRAVLRELYDVSNGSPGLKHVRWDDRRESHRSRLSPESPLQGHAQRARS